MKRLILCLFTISLLGSCNSDDDNTQENSNCINPSSLVISTNQYNGITENVTISNIQLSAECLTIEIAGSGCDGSSWVLNMKAEDAVSLSSPAQRNVALEFINQEACLAALTREFVFDLTDLQIDNANTIIINIVNGTPGNNTITYTY